MLIRTILSSVAVIAIAVYFLVVGFRDGRALYVVIGVGLPIALAWETRRTQRRREAERHDD